MGNSERTRSKACQASSKYQKTPIYFTREISADEWGELWFD